MSIFRRYSQTPLRAMAKPTRRFDTGALFICDLQEKFRTAIYEYNKVISTTQKVLKACQILKIPIFATTQLRSKLGDTCGELSLDAPNGYATAVHADKSLFSMWTPEVRAAASKAFADKPMQVVVVGIESHICVTQTTLDLLRDGHGVYVLADGVSSCNKEEAPIALARLRAAGATVTTSESWLYECMGDAEIDEFREIARLVKETKEQTKEALAALCTI